MSKKIPTPLIFLIIIIFLVLLVGGTLWWYFGSKTVTKTCTTDTDCVLAYTGKNACAPCDYSDSDYQCVSPEKAKKLQQEALDRGVKCKLCGLSPLLFRCICKNNICIKTAECTKDQDCVTKSFNEGQYKCINNKCSPPVVINTNTNTVNINSNINSSTENMQVALEEFRKKYGNQCQVTFDENNGRVKEISGFQTEPGADDIQKTATNFLKDNVFIGLDINDLILTNQDVSTISKHLYYTQMYKNIPIEGSEVVISFDKESRINYIKLETFEVKDLKTDPAITEEQAIETAKNASQQISIEKQESSLTILPVKKNATMTYYLTWKIQLITALSFNRIYFIDAQTGKIIKDYSMIVEG